MHLMKKMFAAGILSLILLSLLVIFTSVDRRLKAQSGQESITGHAPNDNETGIVLAEVVSFVSLNMTDNSVNLGNLTNDQVLNTSFEGNGVRKDVLTIKNVGSSPAEVDFWSRYSLFYDTLNDTGKSCNGGGTSDCRLNAARTSDDQSFKFATEGLTGTGCLIDAYELSVSGFQDVKVDGLGGMSAPQVVDQFAGGDEFNISFRIHVPKYEEAGFLNTTVYVSGIEDIDGQDAGC